MVIKNNETDVLNKKWMQFLQDVVDQNTKYEDHDEIKKILKKKNLKDLNSNGSYINLSLQENLINILDSSTFYQKSSYEKSLVQKRLDEFHLREHQWEYNKKGVSLDHTIILEIFEDSYIKFQEELDLFFNPSVTDLEESQRAHLRFFPHKLQSFVEKVVELLISELHLTNLSYIKNLSIHDYRVIINDYISKKVIFIDLIKSMMSETYYNLFRNESTIRPVYSKNLHEKKMKIGKLHVMEEFRKAFALHVLLFVFHYCVETQKIPDLDIVNVYEKTRNFFNNNSHNYNLEKNTWWVTDFTSSVFVILNTLERSDFFEKIYNEEFIISKEYKKRTVYVLPQKIKDLQIAYTALPRVTPPDDVLKDSLEKDLVNGSTNETSISESDGFIKVLSIAQKKKFGVNPIFLDMVTELLNPKSIGKDISEIETIKNPFETLAKEKLLRQNVKDLQNLLHAGCSNNFSGESIRMQLSQLSIVNTWDTSQIVLKLKEMIKSSELCLEKCVIRRRLAISNLILGRIYEGMPVYITSKFCIRLRLYPYQLYISRTAGIFKHIVAEYTYIKITINGLIALLRCYYIAAEQFCDEFENFVSNTKFSKKSGLKKLYAFFENNTINFLCLKDNFIYVSLLYTDILTAKSTGKTRVMLEIDQKASGSVFLSLALRNKKLAEKSNIISKEKNCPYTYCMEQFPEFYYSSMVNRDDEAFNFLATNRKLHKYAKMCYSYSQEALGRETDFIKRWLIEKKELKQSVKKVLVEFARKYAEFIEFVFPGINTQIQTLLKFVVLVVKDRGEMALCNLNGVKFRWKSFQFKSVTRKSFSPRTKKFVSYRVRVLKTHDGKLINDIAAYKRKFLSYLIHSIDAAVMHFFILTMYEKFSYRINHLHDCVLIHPNYINSFYSIVKELYSGNKLYNIVETSLFDQALNSISLDKIEEAKTLIKEFQNQCDSFENKLKNNEPAHLYQPEH